jgi:hypothetical protein
MVRPVDFTFNEETAVDNCFQHRPENLQTVTQDALLEFANMVDKLRDAGVTVLVLEADQQYPHLQRGRTPTPDAVFPNNWFSTSVDGELMIYPMYTQNRRAERRVEDLIKLLIDANLHVSKLHWVAGDNTQTGVYESELEDDGDQVLEGTGAIVIDHLQQRLYATQSERCHPEKFSQFAKQHGYRENYLFQTQDPKGEAIYHTNVMMSIGEQFAVICDECFVDKKEYQQIKESLQLQREVIEISYQQMSEHFCGNIIQLQNDQGQPVIVMSQSAYEGFSDQQHTKLGQYGQLIPCDIKTIESIGGGSARCMIAEIFLPKQSAQIAV